MFKLNNNIIPAIKIFRTITIICIFSLLNNFEAKSNNFNKDNKFSNDSLLVFKLINLSDDFRPINPDSSMFYALKAMELAESINDKKLIAYAKISKANAFSFRMDTENSLILAKETLSYFTVNADDYGKMKALAALGIAYSIKGEYSTAFNFYINSLKIAGKLENVKQEASILVNLASIYMLNQEYDKSLDFLNSAIKKCDDSLPYVKSLAIINLGILNAVKGDYKSALEYYEDVEKIAQENNFKYQLQIIYTNKAHLFLHLKDYQEAMKNYKLALKYQEELGQLKPIIASLKGIGDIYKDKRDFALAEFYYNKADSIAQKYGLHYEISDILLSRSQLLEEKGDFYNAYKKLQRHYFIKDSLNQLNVRKQIAEIETKYELERKQAQIELLELKEQANLKEIQRQKKIIFAVIIISIIILSLLIFSLIQKKQKFRAYNKLLKMNLESMREEEQLIITPATNLKINDESKENDNDTSGTKYEKSSLTEEEKCEILNNLKSLFKDKKIYLNPDITIDDVAEELKIYKKHISQVINEKLGKNFTTFVNEYRIKEARRMLISDEYRNYSIEGIAKSCGFNSRVTFNNVFNKLTGITPSFFRENAHKASQFEEFLEN